MRYIYDWNFHDIFGMTHKVNHKFNIMPRELFLSPAKAFLIFKIDIHLILYKIFKFVFSGQLHEISMK